MKGIRKNIKVTDTDWADIKKNFESTGEEDEILILSHRVVYGEGGKKQRSVHTLLKTTDQKGGITLVEALINNALQAGDLDGMTTIAETMIKMGAAALQAIRSHTDRISKQN